MKSEVSMKSEKYYSSIKRRIEHENAPRDKKNIAAAKKQDNSPSKQFDFSEIYIPKFPNRLKKGLFRRADLRYLYILGGSFIFHVLFIIFFYHNTSFEVSEETISRLHTNYASLILEQSAAADQEAEDEQRAKAVRETKLEDELAETDKAGEEGKGSAFSRRGRRAKSTTEEANVPDAELLSEERESTRRAREGRRSNASAAVGAMGILQYMQSTVISGNVDDDFLNYTDASQRNFVRMLDGMDASELALMKEQLTKQLRAGDLSIDGDLVMFKEKLRMNRSAPKTKVRDLFGTNTPLEEIEAIPIEKNVEYAEDKTPRDALAKLRKRTVRRTAAELSATIKSHNRAIQDCYKSARRKEVAVKGKILIRISINPKGRVVGVEIVFSTLNYETMERCIVSRARRWRDFGICPTQKGIFSFQQAYSFGDK